MKPSGTVGISSGGASTVVRTLNGGGTIRNGGVGGVTIMVQQQRCHNLTGSVGLTQSSSVSNQNLLLQQKNGGGCGEVIFRRLPNSNVVQVRRVITQQPQQLRHIAAKLSSSESSECEPPTLTISGGAGYSSNAQLVSKSTKSCVGGGCDMNEDGVDLEENESVGEVDVSVAGDKGDEDEDDELLIDQEIDDDEDEDKEGVRRSALELNGEGVDGQYLRHVIETQILNRHKTRIKDWDGTKGHMCQSCHETFLSESGLETHRNRRILHILFYCRNCKRDLSFFNKCRLLQHLRNHRVNPTVTGLQNCTMIRLLPESEYLHFEYEDCTSSSEEEDCGSGGASPPKRLKPSRFRRVRGSGSGGNGNSNDSQENSSVPQPAKVVAPPTTTTAPTSTTSNTVIASTHSGTIKYASGSADKQTSDQVTVIKSIGNICTTSIVLTSPTPPVSNTLNADKDTCSSPMGSSDGPLRIRNLRQITVSSVNDEENGDSEYDKGPLEIHPVVTSSSLVRPQMVKVPAPTTTKEIEASANKKSVKRKYRCYKCEQNFESGSIFFKHLQEAEQEGMSSKSLHRCPTDDIPSWSQCQYVFHTKVFHEKSVPFMCPGCGTENPDYNSLIKHVANDCFYLSLRSRYLCAAASQKCTFANKKSVKTEPEILDHLKKEHSRAVLQCLHCTQGFATDNWLLKHLAEAHNIHVDESKGSDEREGLVSKTTRPLTQCLICNILFPNLSTYLQHVYLNFHVHISHAKILECQSCSAVFETTEELQIHRKQYEKCRILDPFQMKVCSSEEGSPTGGTNQLTMTPTPIKIIANPAALLTSPPNKALQPQRSQLQSSAVKQLTSSVQITPAKSQPPPAAMVTVISSTGATTSPQKLQMQQPRQLQNIQKPLSSAGLPFFQPISQKPSQATTPSTTPQSTNKKTFFDDLLSCQFCERLVLFSSLRKHEDQCSGLSTVAPGFCLTCRQNFGNRRTLARHGLRHIREGLPICLYCNNRNIRPTHPTSNSPSEQETLYALKKHLYSNHTSRLVKFPYQCTLCDRYCRDKRAAEFHIKEHQFRMPNMTSGGPKDDPAPIPTSQEDLQKLIRLRRKLVDPRRKAGKTIEVFYCPVCKNREFALENGLARHLTLVHQKDPDTLNLSLLKKASTARRYALKGPNDSLAERLRPDVSADIRTPPQITPSNSSGSLTISNTSSGTPLSSRFSSSIVLRKRMTSVVRKPAIPQRQIPVTRQRSSTESRTQPTTSTTSTTLTSLITRSASTVGKVRRKDGSFGCLKCPKFTCKTEADFCEHVKWKHVWPETEIQKLQYGNKLEEPSEFWCPECNTMFVAKPSLVRHLKFAHDYISNVEEYMQNIGYDGKKPLKANQCEVCYYQCADDRELQQHIRTHGMAFLRLRQQRQASVK